MILSVSWRNIWRNKVRSSIIIIAITLGLFAGVFSNAFMQGMMKQRTNNAVKTELSHIQVHANNYIETNENTKIIRNSNDIKTTIEQISHVKSVSNRTISNAMINSAETGSGVKLIGVVPEDEKQVTDMFKKIKQGKYLEGIKRNPILIGEKLAKKLKVKVRNKVRITIQQFDGTLTYESFRVAGIFKTVNTTYDEMNAFVKKEDLISCLKMPEDACHEIAIFLDEHTYSDTVNTIIQSKYPELDSRTWMDLSPEMKLLQQSMNTMSYAFIVIILFALLFGIINTMLMAILERTKELGMLMAIGMNKVKVFSMIMIETIYVTLVGGFTGTFIGYIVVYFFGQNGFDLSAMYGKGLEAYGYDPIIYPSIDLQGIMTTAILVLLTGFIASIFPARKALKLNPAEAIRTDM